MTPRLALLFAACLTLPQTALADRFYFGSAETEKQMAGAPDYIEGVLLSRQDDLYVIRVVGGQITVPESSIYKVVGDDLTAEDIAARERAQAPKLAEANQRRREAMAEAEQQRRQARDEAEECEQECDRECEQKREQECEQECEHGIGARLWRYDPVLDTSVSLARKLRSVPVTPERADRGLSRYRAAQEHSRRMHR